MKKLVRKILDNHGVWYYMPVSGGLGAHGIHDFVCCHCGMFFTVECKATAKEVPTALQLKVARDITKAGGTSLLIHDKNTNVLEKFVVSLMRQ